MVSLRDEIVPAEEADVLRQYVRQLHLIANDDVHGSPGHTSETRLWVALSLQRLRGVKSLQVKALSGMLGLLRARSAVTSVLTPGR
jgi:esterase FrsA